MPRLGHFAVVIALGLAPTQRAAAQSPIRLETPTAEARAPLQIHLSTRYDGGAALKAQGIARTFVERDLQGGSSSAAMGFLCGMQPSTQTHGAAGALGVDGEGRFLGAQLRFGFR